MHWPLREHAARSEQETIAAQARIAQLEYDLAHARAVVADLESRLT
jgi:hypothetical protein